MESQHCLGIAFTTLIYLALLLQPATGKCVGKWAIHACFGGNGKRSDPSLSQTVDNQRQTNVLRQLLLRESYPQTNDLEMNLERDEQDDSRLNRFEEEFPEIPTDERQREIDRLNNLLKTLLLQRKLRLAAEQLA